MRRAKRKVCFIAAVSATGLAFNAGFRIERLANNRLSVNSSASKHAALLNLNSLSKTI